MKNAYLILFSLLFCNLSYAEKTTELKSEVANKKEATKIVGADEKKQEIPMDRYKQKEISKHFEETRSLKISSLSWTPIFPSFFSEVSLASMAALNSDLVPLPIDKFMDSERLLNKIEEAKN